MRLKDKVALIAGAGPGMGRATALLFAQEGAKVGVVARDPNKGEETTRRITANGGEVIAMAGDLIGCAEPVEITPLIIDISNLINIVTPDFN